MDALGKFLRIRHPNVGVNGLCTPNMTTECSGILRYTHRSAAVISLPRQKVRMGDYVERLRCRLVRTCCVTLVLAGVVWPHDANRRVHRPCRWYEGIEMWSCSGTYMQVSPASLAVPHVSGCCLSCHSMGCQAC